MLKIGAGLWASSEPAFSARMAPNPVKLGLIPTVSAEFVMLTVAA
jgi:hypothetical protein